MKQAIIQIEGKPLLTPASLSWAAVVAMKTPDTRFTKVTRKHKELKSKLPTLKLPAAEQKVLVQLEKKSTITVTQFLTIANEVLRQYTDLTAINFITTYLTKWENLVFDTSVETEGTEYEPYFPALWWAVGRSMTFPGVVGETSWDRFLLHDIRLDTTMEEISTFLCVNHLQLQLAQIPRWLVTD